MKEIELQRKEDIIKNLVEQNNIAKKYNVASPCEEFIRGYIMGATTDLDFPSHWYDEIIKKVQA